MTNKFITVSYAESEDDIIINKLLKKLPSKLYLTYLLKYLPINVGLSTYMGEEIEHIILPFIEEEAHRLDKNYIDKFLKKLEDTYDLSSAYFTQAIYKYTSKEEEECKSLLKYILLEDIIDKILEENDISAKDMKLVILDSNNRRIEYVLEVLISKLNYLTIVTNRENYFSDFIDAVYDSYGLVVETLKTPLKENVEANIIIDLDPNCSRNYSYYNEDSIILDMESTIEKRQYMYARRKRLKFIHDIDTFCRGEKVDAVKFALYLSSQYWIVRSFMTEKNKNYSAYDIQTLKGIYDISLSKLIKL